MTFFHFEGGVLCKFMMMEVLQVNCNKGYRIIIFKKVSNIIKKKVSKGGFLGILIYI